MKPRWDEDRQKRMLEALIARLQNCKAGEIYPLDPVEREVILVALNQKSDKVRL